MVKFLNLVNIWCFVFCILEYEFWEISFVILWVEVSFLFNVWFFMFYIEWGKWFLNGVKGCIK